MADPFATPAAGVPAETWWTLWSMGSRFTVGRHRIEVDTWHWTGLTVVRVDGEEVHRDRNVGWHARIDVPAGARTVQVITRWYPLQPVRVEVDGSAFLDDLFPQRLWLLAIGATIVLPLAMTFSGSILYDLWRFTTLQTPL